ncbi:siderophore-interacting protein [Vibrio aphrogenes]|uniref:siderophore-interacting protein n=1 Tax=Vibrio aphrogenes TaxID=1891186 RepID=UPI000B34CD7E|nr:siderophore-interacting protein [Vibrio aphrogenes]
MKPNRKPKHTCVVEVFKVSPTMQRIVLQGEDLKTLQKSDLGNYIKLMFHPQGHTNIDLLSDNERPLMRTYTISELDIELGKISVDFVIHESSHAVNPEQGGYAVNWAMAAQAGDEIYIGGPGKSQDIDFHAEQVVLVADMTAIPAMKAKLDTLNDSAQGYVVVQIATEADKPELALPQGVQLITVVGTESEQLADAVTALKVINVGEKNDIAIWCACEFSAMKSIRNYFTEHDCVQREKSYFSSYWKQGITEDGHKVIKREDAESLTQ